MSKFQDINVDYTGNAQQAYIVDLMDIRYSLVRLFQTRKGSCPWNRDYGSCLLDLLFEAGSMIDVVDLKVLLYNDITRWEPRVELSPLDISITKQDEHTYIVQCAFTVPALNNLASDLSTTLTDQSKAQSVGDEDEYKEYTLTINTIPKTAEVILEADGKVYYTNSLSVLKDTVIFWRVVAEGYETQSGSIKMTSTQSLNVALQVLRYSFKINTIPENANVQFKVGSQVYDQSEIIVDSGTEVFWTVSANEYVTQTGSQVVKKDTTLPVKLDKVLYSYSIIPFPVDAVVTLTAQGYYQEGNTIKVPSATIVNWKVEREGYHTQEGGELVVSSTVKTVELAKADYTFTVSPITPSDALVKLKAPDVPTVEGQGIQSIVVPYDTEVEWVVSKAGYGTQHQFFVVKQDYTLPVTLEENIYNVVFIANTPNAYIIVKKGDEIIAEGTSRVIVPAAYGVQLTYSATAVGYEPASGTVTVDDITTVNIDLEAKLYTLTINPDPDDSQVTLVAEGYTQEGNSITVKYDTSVSWTVEKEGYGKQTGTEHVIADKTLDISLTLNTYTVVISPTPTTAIVELTSEGGELPEGNKIIVPYGTVIHWSVSQVGYITTTGQETITRDRNISVVLTEAEYLLTVNAVPLNARITLEVSGKEPFVGTGSVEMSVKYGTTVVYSVIAGEAPEITDMVTVIEDTTININAYPEIDLEEWEYTQDPVTYDVTLLRYIGSHTNIEVP